MTEKAKWSEAVIRVGGGRGFIVETALRGAGMERLVITAAHCLPDMPPADRSAYTEEYTFANLLGPLDEEPAVWAECLFYDPIADVAVLGPPDNQQLYEEYEQYSALVADRTPMEISSIPLERELIVPRIPKAEPFLGPLRGRLRGWILSLEGEWLDCEIEANPTNLNLKRPTQAGMSGSPIANEAGAAVGVVCISSEGQPNLMASLPGWFLTGLGIDCA